MRPALLACVLVILSLGPVDAQSLVTIYVGPTETNGIVNTDKGIEDSIADLRSELNRTKRFTVAHQKEGARVQLLVVSRTVGEGGPVVGVPVGNTVMALPIGTYQLKAVLHAGEYEREFSIVDMNGSWRYAARRLAQDVQTWADANRAVLTR